MRAPIRLLLAAVGILIMAAGSARAADAGFRAVATTAMVGDLVRAVAGDTGEVTVLLGEGVDPHLYKLTRGDVSTLAQADILFFSGLRLEGKMADALDSLKQSGRPVVAVAEGVETGRLQAPPDFPGQYDPHLWMDIGTWASALDVVRDALTRLRPAQAGTFARNAAAYREELGELDHYARRVLATVPPRSRVLVTAHDAFGYFGRAYGFEVIGIQGLSTESEAGIRRIGDLVELLAERQVGAVFVETSVSDRNLRALIEGAAARGHRVVIGGSLFSDAMGPPGRYEGTYIGMLDHNVTTIARALGGEVPPGGLHGRLAGL